MPLQDLYLLHQTHSLQPHLRQQLLFRAHLRRTVPALLHVARALPFQHNQRRVRDLYFGQEQRGTFLDKISELCKEKKLLSSINFSSSLYQECIIDKYLFWNKVKSLTYTTKEASESAALTEEVYLDQVGPFWLAGVLASSLILFVPVLRNSKKSIAFATFTIIGSFHLIGKYRLSSDIFNNIPKLPDKELQEQKEHIMHRCLVTDLGALQIYSNRDQYKKNWFNSLIFDEAVSNSVEKETEEDIASKIKR